MAQRKLLSQQKSRLTKDTQETKKATEEALGQLTELKDTAPEWLDKTAKKEWNRILPLIRELPVAALDLALLSMYCQTYSNYINATKQLEKEMVTVTERGTKLSSFYTIQRDSITAMNSIAPKLGLTVESRLKIMEPKTEKPQDDAFAQMIASKGRGKTVYDVFGVDDDD
ncbi:phage terminase small subunit P27 family [Staphylococcus saprophyticus]|nr:phage terminase small subunit P27 family [Staphylococcus saprophyticus]MDW4253963.1 phage terminase small subunit P27 family [Staphylococcus saprophyticus]MDW4312428.1 phage terminase small subunit P27 family [Staphylococcus saprophyticus]